MATHFSSIGLSITSDVEAMELIERVAIDTERLPTPHGTYLRWTDPSGAELWIQLNADNDPVGLNPHFGGLSKVRVLLTDRLDTGSGCALDGRFHAWADPDKAVGDHSGSYPFLFDAPDAASHEELTFPAEFDVQIAAFAHDVDVFANPKAFEAAQTGSSEYWNTAQTFIPTGLMGGKGLRAEATFTGIVRKTERRKNQLTGAEFVWCLVSSRSGVYDVVADPELMPQLPSPGGVVTGTFWLTGRIGACAKAAEGVIQSSEGWKRGGRSHAEPPPSGSGVSSRAGQSRGSA